MDKPNGASSRADASTGTDEDPSKRPFYVKHKHYNIDMNKNNRLGKGATGKVYPGINLNTGDDIAAKKISVYKEYIDTVDFKKEYDLLMNTVPPHENIIKVYDLFQKEYQEKGIGMVDIWIISEVCELGNLAEYCQQNELTSEDKLELFYQSALALLHLHQCEPDSVTHRDVKPENVLVTDDSGKPRVKLCDFGAARAVEREDGLSVMMKSVAGTPLYIAPEQVELQDGFDKSVDQFSLGVTALALLDSRKGKAMEARKLCGRGLGRALCDINKTCDMTANDFTLPINNTTDNALEKAMKQVIKKMLQFDPKDRPSMAEIVENLSKLRKSDTKGAVKGKSLANESTEGQPFRQDETSTPKVSATKSSVKPLPKASREKTATIKCPAEKQTDPISSVKKSSTENLSQPKGKVLSAPDTPTPPSGKECLVAVYNDFKKGTTLWVKEEVNWITQKNHPHGAIGGICWCTVPDGIIGSGGLDGLFSKRNVFCCYKFSMHTRSWHRLPDMNIARHCASAAVLGEVMFVVGGRDSKGFSTDVCERFHLTDHVWSSAESMRKPLQNPLVVTAAGKMFVIERTDQVRPGTRIQQYDPVEDCFTWGPALPDINTEGACVVSAADILYLLGGVQRLAVQYNPSTQQFSQLESQPRYKYYDITGCCALVHNAKILLCGGSLGGNDCDMIDSYDPKQNTWTKIWSRLPFSYYRGASHIASIFLSQ